MTTDLFQAIASVSLALLGFVLIFKKNSNVQPIFNLLLLLLGLNLLQNLIQPEEKQQFITGLLASIAGINLLVSYFISTKKYRWAVPVVSILLLLLLGDHAFQFGEYPLNFSSFKTTSIIILGMAIGALGHLFALLFKRFFAEYHQKTINLTAQAILVALLLIPATFICSWYGIILLAVGYFIYNCYSTLKNDSIFISLTTLAILAGLQSKLGIDSIDLTVGKLVAGLFVGVAVVSIGKLALKTNNTIIRTLFLIIAIVSLFVIATFNNVHPAYGGPESLLAALFGISAHLLIAGNRNVANFIVPASVAIALLLPREIVETETTDGTGTPSTTNKTEVEEVEPSGVDASSLQGKYSVEKETAKISFQLGPKGGITKGAIKNFEGTVDFGTDISAAKFNITLPTKNLTTFNSMRDESVHGESYLNEAKFPLMKFTSEKVEKQADGYVLKGTFQLLGNKNDQEVFIKYLGEKDGKKQFFGKSSIDRTRYGMKSSPQEGNVIDFTFTMELK